MFWHELYPTSSRLSSADWQAFLCAFCRLQPIGRSWRLVAQLDGPKLHFYLEVPSSLPASLPNAPAFLAQSLISQTASQAISQTANQTASQAISQTASQTAINADQPLCAPFYASPGTDFCALHARLRLKHDLALHAVVIRFVKLAPTRYHAVITFRTSDRRARTRHFRLFGPAAVDLLAIDFASQRHFLPKTPPKYLDASKALKIFRQPPVQSSTGTARPNASSVQSAVRIVQPSLRAASLTTPTPILAADAFPYLDSAGYLAPTDYDFAKHSLILGASGSGKSKFIAAFVAALCQDPALRATHRIVVIDPHAALATEIGGLARVIDFSTPDRSLDLFDNDPAATRQATSAAQASFSSQTTSAAQTPFSSQTTSAAQTPAIASSPTVATELLLDLFRGLLADRYNAKLERVLRHAFYLLIAARSLDFTSLRCLLLDLEFRHQLLAATPDLSPSVQQFFYTEFSEIKTRSYTEAIAPIIALIDEVAMVPIFSQPATTNLRQTLTDHFCTLVSLSRVELGDRVTRTVAGLLMQQLFTLIEQPHYAYQTLLIIDEVAVVENPILGRFLAEARKFGLSLILAGQYFGAITPALRTAIFANASNYYLFRVAEDDARLLATSLKLKIPLDDTLSARVKLLSELQNRECVLRLSAHHELLPAIKCHTLDFTPQPASAPMTDSNHHLATPTTSLAASATAPPKTEQNRPHTPTLFGFSPESPSGPPAGFLKPLEPSESPTKPPAGPPAPLASPTAILRLCSTARPRLSPTILENRLRARLAQTGDRPLPLVNAQNTQNTQNAQNTQKPQNFNLKETLTS